MALAAGQQETHRENGWRSLRRAVVVHVAGPVGAIGVLLGSIVLLIMGAVGIEATNQFLQILLGGEVFRPQISASAIILSMIMMSIVGVVSSLYPVSVALKVSPLEAMNKG